MKGTMRMVLLGTALLAGSAGPAWAHVTAEDPSVPKDSETEITFSVPVEEGGHTHGMHAMHEGEEPAAGESKGEPSKVYNEEVTIEVPRGFEVMSCDQTADWKCEAEPNKGSPSAGDAGYRERPLCAVLDTGWRAPARHEDRCGFDLQQYRRRLGLLRRTR